MTNATVRLELDENGELRPLTPDQCMTVLTEWAGNYPSARFMVVAIAPDGTDGTILGWGLALPEHAFAHLPELGLTTRFRTAGDLVHLLNRLMDARLIWIDPEPEQLPDDPES